MPKKATGSTTPGDVSAAHQWIDDASMKLSKHGGALKTYIETLEDSNAELAEKHDAAVARHEKEMSAAKANYDREVIALTARTTAAEDKLRRAFGELQK